MRFGCVSIVGRPNVGKSTFLNAALGERLAIVSPVPQTTRDALLGVVHRPDCQIAFLDTPGMHRPKSELGRRMNAAAETSVVAADVVVFVTDVTGLQARLRNAERRRALAETLGEAPKASSLVHPEDVVLLERVPKDVPCILVVNKVDLLRSKRQLLPLLEALGALRSFEEIVPVSLHDPLDVERLLELITPRLPEGQAGYEADTLTDKPTSFFVREYVREQILLRTAQEVPHAVSVTIDRFEETQKQAVVHATIHVEKVGQRKILVGAEGQTLRQIRESATARVRELMGKKVQLHLFVRVTPRWRNAPRQLAEMGYDLTAGEAPRTRQGQ